MHTSQWIKNVQLEKNYKEEDGYITGAETELSHLLIKSGKIEQIISADQAITDNIPQIDAKGLLALPSFIEKHCHLDKTLLSDEWRPVIPTKNIFERFEVEKRVLPTLATTTRERAEKLLDIYSHAGVTKVRTHVDLYPEAGLKNLDEVKKALHIYENKLASEIVAFPQHGLLRSDSKHLVKEALRQGAGYVGGVDPANVDGNIEASLQTMIELAVEAEAGIDLHLHDADHLGTFTMKRLAELTMEAGLQGKVYISHAFGLGDVSLNQAEELAEMLADAGVGIISSVPNNRKFPPLELLKNKGVETAVGCDNIFDVWSPFGNGDILERLGQLAEIYRWVDQPSLTQSLGYITGGKTTLTKAGKQAWPKAGDEANMVFVKASCSAEAVARRSERVATMFKGNVVAGEL
ncbi:amidohydrolase [Oceanobacillus sojae]|uniref:amidohydrolase n=1 Tax=Oceanobacillus sojae TaxID=582851 RepID=UPI0021A62169|nr:amidohydrolase [Oceanobacillus sojae]MCT1902463.1 amidohydrolase [Oceanobacillus sojae]